MPKEATFFLSVFIFVMVFVTVVAYSRPSGSTGQDPVKIDLIRRNS